MILACIAINVLVDVALVSWVGWGLNGIATGSMLTYFAYWMAHSTLVRHYYGQGLPVAFAANLSIGWPGLVLGAYALLEAWHGDLSTTAMASSLAVAALVCLCAAIRWLTSSLGPAFDGAHA